MINELGQGEGGSIQVLERTILSRLADLCSCFVMDVGLVGVDAESFLGCTHTLDRSDDWSMTFKNVGVSMGILIPSF